MASPELSMPCPSQAEELWDDVPAVQHRFRDSCRDASEADEEHQIVVSPFPPGRWGNIVCFVNDPGTTQPGLLPTSGDDAGAGGSGRGLGHAPSHQPSRANATVVNVRALAVPMGESRDDKHHRQTIRVHTAVGDL
jgi:hypothetical protein